MTTPKQINLKNLFNGMLFGTLVVMLMLATVGCDKKKSSSNNNNPFYCPPGQFCGYPGGPGGPGINPGYGQGIVGEGQDMSSGSRVILEFVTSGVQNFNPYFASGQTYLYGQIETQGIQCQWGGFVPGGIYSITTQQPANAQNGIVYNAQVVAQGNGGYLQITVSDARIQLPMGQSFGQYDDLWANLVIQTVNGQPCNQIMTVYP